MTSWKLARLVFAAMLLALMVGALPSAVFATSSVQPIDLQVGNDIKCQVKSGPNNDIKDFKDILVDGDWPFGSFNEFKVNGSNLDGVHDVPGWGTITIKVTEKKDGTEPVTVEWSSTFGIDIVIVKAKSNNAYVYDPESFGQSGVSAPLFNGKKQGISHITFCWDNDTPKLQKLIVKKELKNDNGGTKAKSDFRYTIKRKSDGEEVFSGNFESDGENKHYLPPGEYIIIEEQADGYQITYKDDCANNQTVNLGNNDTDTCTIRNDDIPPKLTLVKQVKNDNGGTAGPEAWKLKATKGSYTVLQGYGTVSSGANFQAGTYTLNESDGPAGYAAGDWSCTGGTQNGNTITLGIGQTATCTITNDDIPPSLTLVKEVINNNGGTATANQWTLHATSGSNVLQGSGPQVSSGPDFKAGEYTLSESGGPAGYAAGDWVCTGTGSQNGNTITLGIGQSATCTITNNDIPPSLTLVKQVTNNNGGTATADAWTLHATGPTSFSGTSGVSSGAHYQDGSFQAGEYTLSESGGPTGYSAGDWSCTGDGTLNADKTKITLGIGQSATCTITNDDIPPKLTLKKDVKNNDGGTASPEAWTLHATGPTSFSGTNGISSGPDFQVGEYTLSESGGPTGYTALGWSCTGDGTLNGDKITLGIGQTAECTITNDDQPGTLIITKITDPAEGEGKVFYFTVKRGDTTVVQNLPITRTTNIAGDSYTLSNLQAGVYSINEVQPAGWTLVGVTCTSDNQTSENPDAIQLDPGETVTCVFDNDPLPSLSVTKTPQQTSLPEPGGWFTYDVVVTNTSDEEVTLTSLVDDKFGDLDGKGNCALPQSLAPNGGAYSCSFQGEVKGNAGLKHVNTVTVKGVDDEQTEVSASAPATVTLTDVLPTILVEKTPSAPQTEPGGGNIVFTVVVTNTSVEPVTVISLNDDVFGDLNGKGDCKVDVVLQPNESYTCAFTALITQDHKNTVTAIAQDDEGNSATDDDDAVVVVPATPEKSALGNFVWYDLDGNGLQDPDEPGVPGVIVNLLNGIGDFIRSTTTDFSGLYLFGNLDAGDYIVEFIKPEAADGFTIPGQPDPAANSDADQTTGRTGQIGLPSGTTDLTWDAGLLCTNGIIAGTLNAGPHSGNIPILLLPQNNPNATPLFLATNPDGSFKFTQVAPGTYLVQVHDAYLSAHGLTPAQGSNTVVQVTVQPCRTVTVNFVYTTGAGALGDLVWYDVNGNGSQDEWRDANNDGAVTKNEPPQGQPIPLDQFEWYDINGNNTVDEGELNKCGLYVPATGLLTLFSSGDLNTPTAGQGTGVTGYYRFNQLALGQPGWTVTFDATNPALHSTALAMFQSGLCKPLPGNPPAPDNNGGPGTVTTCSATTPTSDQAVLSDGQLVYLDADFGIRCVAQPMLTALGDLVWEDTNANGLQDQDEPGVPNVTVNLYRVGTAAPISTTVTGNDGRYWFADLPLGDYFVEFVTPAGRMLTQANVQNNGQDALDSDAIAPVVNIQVSDGGIRAALGKPLTYTLSYANVDQLNAASGVVLHTVVPVGTVADLAASTPGWSCAATPAVGGVACSLTVGNVAAGASGSAQFVVVVGENDGTTPTTIELQASLTHTTPGRTHVTTPPAGGADPTLDAGLVTGEQRQQTSLSTVRDPGSIPTSLDETDQPGRGHRLFIPAAMR